MDEYTSPQGFKMLPTGVKNLLIINVLCYLAYYVVARRFYIDINVLFGVHTLSSGFFHIWQPITYMFMHANFSHIFFNMFALWMFGYTLENVWGTRKFLVYYLLCGLGAGIASMLMPGNACTVGASGAVYGILLAFGMMFPESRIYFYFLVPIKAKWFVLGYALLELFEGVFYTSDGVAHFAHLAGMVVGLIIILFWRHRKKQQDDRWRWQNNDQWQ